MRKKERKEERRKQRYIKKRAEDEQNKHKPSILKLYKLYLGFLPGWCFLLFLGHLKWISVLMLYAPVFIFTSGSSAHVVIYRSDCRYLPHSIHFSEFMPIYFTRKWTKHENTRSAIFVWYGNCMARRTTGSPSKGVPYKGSYEITVVSNKDPKFGRITRNKLK